MLEEVQVDDTPAPNNTNTQSTDGPPPPVSPAPSVFLSWPVLHTQPVISLSVLHYLPVCQSLPVLTVLLVVVPTFTPSLGFSMFSMQ